MNPVSRVCRNALCAPIRFYQRFISPGLGRNCRFTPTCSQYGIEAIQTHGCIKGLLLTAWRIARCNPLGRWGFDPVPPKGRWVKQRAYDTRLLCTTSPSLLRNATSPGRGGFGSPIQLTVLPRAPLLGELATPQALTERFNPFLCFL